MQIYFIRHGETDRNLNEMINPGDVDSELNQNGINQANIIGKKLQSEGFVFDVIISSPLKRAKHTANIIAEKIGYLDEIIEVNNLKEKYAGIFKNYYKKQFKEEFGVRIVEEILQKYPNKTFEGVEKLKDFEKRIKNVFLDIKNNKKYKNKNILIVSHGGVAEVITGIKKIENCKLIKISI